MLAGEFYTTRTRIYIFVEFLEIEEFKVREILAQALEDVLIVLAELASANMSGWLFPNRVGNAA